MAWSDRENRKVCIGVPTWDGRELIVEPDVRRVFVPSVPRPVVAETGDPRLDVPALNPYMWVKCACGRRKQARSARCVPCAQANRRHPRKKAA